MGKAKLYGNTAHFRTQKVLAAAKYGGKFDQLTVVNEQPPKDHFPIQTTPALEDGKTLLFGAESIALHLGGTSVRGQKPDDQLAEIVQWLQWSEGQLLPSVLAYVLPSVSAMEVNKKAIDESRSELIGRLGTLNDYLLTRTYLVGERMSLADISVAFDLIPAFQHVLDGAVRAQLINVVRWFQTVVNQPHVKEVVGSVELCEKVEHFDSKKLSELKAKVGGSGDHHHHGKDAGKKKDKKEKKKSEEPAAEEMDASEEAQALEPKAVDPFAALPKGTFVMDSFKRVYSNEDTETKALPYFWENFDKENYSIWFGEYKYPEDLTLTFMSANLIGGMFQRLEKLKKHAFGSVCLFGDNNNSTISGIWVWRGHDLAFTLSPDLQVDYESYKWTKLNPDDEKTKKMIKEYFCWEGDFDGRKFNQGKIFK